jgi:hypothetical protein
MKAAMAVDKAFCNVLSKLTAYEETLWGVSADDLTEAQKVSRRAIARITKVKNIYGKVDALADQVLKMAGTPIAGKILSMRSPT